MFSSATFLEVYLGIFGNPKNSSNVEQMRKTASPQCLVNIQMSHVYPTNLHMTFDDIFLENKDKTKNNAALWYLKLKLSNLFL